MALDTRPGLFFRSTFGTAAVGYVTKSRLARLIGRSTFAVLFLFVALEG